jgi:hypothetical protein
VDGRWFERRFSEAAGTRPALEEGNKESEKEKAAVSGGLPISFERRFGLP